MKKVYEAPAVEKIEFQYRDQVVARSGEACTEYNGHTGAVGSGQCTEGNVTEPNRE